MHVGLQMLLGAKVHSVHVAQSNGVPLSPSFYWMTLYLTPCSAERKKDLLKMIDQLLLDSWFKVDLVSVRKS